MPSDTEPNIVGGPLDGDWYSPPWLMRTFSHRGCARDHKYAWDGERWQYQPQVERGVLDRLYRKDAEEPIDGE